MDSKKFMNYILSTSGLKQCEVAKKMEVTEVTISRYLNGTRIPKITTAESFCKACGYSTLLDALIEYEESGNKFAKKLGSLNSMNTVTNGEKLKATFPGMTEYIDENTKCVILQFYGVKIECSLLWYNAPYKE